MRFEIVSIEPEVGAPEGLETDALELEVAVPAAATFDPQAFAEQLGREWSARRGGTPAPGPMTTWLLKDHNDTMAGAQMRDGLRKYSKGQLGRGWAISRIENMKFQLDSTPGLRRLARFDPPPPPVALVRDARIGGTSDAPVAPLIVRLFDALHARYGKPFRASNYPRHGGGSFSGRGFSLDLWLSGTDGRGFYRPADAIAFLRALDAAARDVGAEWRVLYNDFSVADAINRETGIERVLFVGRPRYADAKNAKVAGINWHGPDPLILHFHLDVTPKAFAATGGATVSKPPAQPLPGAMPPASKHADAIVGAGIASGQRNPDKLTDMVFFQRHPERQGRALQKGEPHFDQLAREWTAIKSQVVVPLLKQRGLPTPAQKPTATLPVTGLSSEAAAAVRIGKRQAGKTGTTIESLVNQWRQRICPEIPMSILLAFIAKESGGNFSDATHGTAGNNWTVPAFYELGLFQTPAGLHGRCTGKDAGTCEFGPPGRETGTPSTWARLCKQIGADPKDWTNPVTQVRVGLMDLETAAARLRGAFPTLFPRPGSDWDLRMAVLYAFSRGGGAARSFLQPFHNQLAALPEDQRWALLRGKVVTVAGTGGAKVARHFRGENVEAKMALAAQLGYVPS